MFAKLLFSVKNTLTGKNRMKNIYQLVYEINQKLIDIDKTVQLIAKELLPPPASQLIFIVGGVEVKKMQLKDNKSMTVSFAVKDAVGNPTVLAAGSVVSWAADNANLAFVVPSADGMTAVVTPMGPLGSFNVQCSIPAIGDEIALNGTLPVEVITSEATTLELVGTV